VRGVCDLQFTQILETRQCTSQKLATLPGVPPAIAADPPPEATVQRLADRERDVHVQGLQVASCICRGQPEGIWKDRRSNQCLGLCVISYTPAHVLGVGGSPKVRHSFSILDVASPPSQQPISYLEIRLANVQAWCLLRSLLSSACYHTSSKSNGVDCPMGLQ
jgi:hypothetical protein